MSAFCMIVYPGKFKGSNGSLLILNGNLGETKPEIRSIL